MDCSRRLLTGLLCGLLAAGAVAQEQGQAEDSAAAAVAPVTSRPSWRSADDTPARPELPPAVERPDFEFSVEPQAFERPSFDTRPTMPETTSGPDPDLGRVATWRERRDANARAEEVAAEEAAAADAAAAEAAEEVLPETSTAAEPETEVASALAAVTPPESPLLDVDADPAEPSGATPADYRLRPASTVSPDYPRQAYLDRAEGWVDVEFVVTPDGRVDEVRVVEAQPRRTFDRAALRAATGWQFQPPSAHGIVAAQSAVFRFEFKMDDRN